MQANSPAAWMLSATFHAAVVALVIALTWWLNRSPEINPMIFELVEFSERTVAPAGETAPAAAVKFTTPKVQPEKRVEPPKPEPQKQPPPVKQAVPVEKTPPKPTPQKSVSYEEFLKQQGKTLEKNANPTPRPVKAPRIDTSKITSELQQYARAGIKDGAMNSAQIRELDAYIARLITALRMAHEKPAGVSELLKAKVSFYVAPDGTLSAVRIVTTSGDPEFDKSVVDAFRKVRSIGSVPGGKGHTWELTFRMTEE